MSLRDLIQSSRFGTRIESIDSFMHQEDMIAATIYLEEGRLSRVILAEEDPVAIMDRGERRKVRISDKSLRLYADAGEGYRQLLPTLTRYVPSVPSDTPDAKTYLLAATDLIRELGEITDMSRVKKIRIYRNSLEMRLGEGELMISLYHNELRDTTKNIILKHDGTAETYIAPVTEDTEMRRVAKELPGLFFASAYLITPDARIRYLADNADRMPALGPEAGHAYRRIASTYLKERNL